MILYNDPGSCFIEKIIEESIPPDSKTPNLTSDDNLDNTLSVSNFVNFFLFGCILGI